MFESVGRDLDEEANRRRAKAGAIVIGLSAFTWGMVVAAGLWVIREVVVDQIQADIVEVAMEEEAPMEAPPPPPPPPPPPAAAAAEEEEQEEVTPDDLVDETQELKEEVKEEMKSDAKPAGVEGGVEGGVVGGQVGGVQGGVVGGVVGGQLGGNLPPPKVVYYKDIEWKKQPLPIYPEQARSLNLGDQTCDVKFSVDEQGVPYNIKIDKCPQIFHAGTIEAVSKWRAYPHKENGVPVKIGSRQMFTYKLNN